MNILYEDSQILVCYKEAGLPVQSGRIGKKDLVSILKNYLWEQNGRKGRPYLGVVHRLDQPVEGVLVFARTPAAAGKLSAQAADGRMKKIYHAVVKRASEDSPGGKLPQEGLLEDYLLKDNRTNRSEIVPEGTGRAKLARLEYRILGKAENAESAGQALAEIRLHTGRHHQIRAQMAGAGMPLCGDRKYGDIPAEESGKKRSGESPAGGGLALCAVSLRFLHPGTGEEMEFHCEPQGEYFVRGKFFAVK